MTLPTRRKLAIVSGLCLVAFCALEVIAIPALVYVFLSKDCLSRVPSWPIVLAFAGVPCALVGGILDHIVSPRRIIHSHETRR
jgi:hypothetical protein